MKNFRIGFCVLVVLSLLLSGCDDTVVDPAKKKRGKAPQILPADVDVAAYMQPVYDRLFERVAKFLKVSTDPNAPVDERKAVIKRVRDFIAHYKDSNFPDNFLEVLAEMETHARAYNNAQKTGMRGGRTGEHIQDSEKRCRAKIIELMKQLNGVVEIYGCTPSEVPK